jgi:hypothetical protein
MKKLKSYKDFQETLQSKAPNKDWSLPLQAIWFVANGDWEASHHITQDLETPEGSLIHAYLHRKEGDEINAAYWYGKANKPFPKISLEEEFKEIVTLLL